MNDNKELLLMDFWFYADIIGLEYPENLDEYSLWIPPTEQELACCNWVSDQWSIFFYLDDADSNYAGTVELYNFGKDGMDYNLVYTGIWRMEGDCLRLEIANGDSNDINGSFPVLIDSDGVYLHVQQELETGLCPPFFEEGMTSIDLWQAYG